MKQEQTIKEYRQEIIEDLRSLTFAQKRKVLKQADKTVLDSVNYHQGVKYLHTLDYVKRFPSKHQKTLNTMDEILLVMRTIFIRDEKQKFFEEKRKNILKLV
jgi:rRNA pseudouridine-1189 N-methylase Emg1 (Nep1/Mra1 family)